MKYRALFIAFFAAALLFATNASANIGIPMLAVAWPTYWFAFVPVVIFEAFLARKIIQTEWKASFKVSTLANLFSTFVGIPLTWLGMLAIEYCFGFIIENFEINSNGIWGIIFFPLYAAWIGPVEDFWVVYAAFVVLAVPFCIASIYLESKAGYTALPETRKELIISWARRSNVLSYFFIIIGMGIYGLITNKP